VLTIDSAQNCFSTGIDDLVTEEQWSINPNLIAENCELQIADFAFKQSLNLSLFDVTGRKIWGQTIVSSLTQLNLQDIEKGIYFAQIGQEGNFATKRIVKQ
jgi:hypothetical protein